VTLAVGFKGGVTASTADGRLRTAGLRAPDNPFLARLGVRTVTVARADSTRVAAALRADPDVAYVQPDAPIHTTDVTPDDPLYPQQTELPQITVPAAWSTTTGSPAVTVAVVDSGVSELGDITGAVLPGWDFVNNDDDANDETGHGTAVASLIAGRGNDGNGMAGVCWSCKILPLKVFDSSGSGSMAVGATAIVYAADHGVKIINASFGGYTPFQPLADAVAYAQSKGALVIASAGNDAVKTPLYPAAYSGVVAVGGTDEDSDFFVAFDPWTGIYGSNYGPDWVDVAAPWCSIAIDRDGFADDTGGADVDDNDYQVFCGTSGAAPLVSGTVALMKSKAPAAGNAALVQALTSTARPTETTGFTQFGEIRAGAALAAVDLTAPKITGATPAQNTRFRGTVTLGASGVSDTGSGVAYAALYANGTLVGKDTTAPYAVKYASGTRNGTVAFQWRVFDKAGNSAVYNRALIADNKPPAVKITSAPANGAKVKGTVTVKASASDISGVDRVELIINGKVVAKDAAAPYVFKVSVSKYGKKIKVQVRATDKVGNPATSPTRTWKR
jgi:subtilisin family serine protease